jgi:predicted transcriptional regulator
VERYCGESPITNENVNNVTMSKARYRRTLEIRNEPPEDTRQEFREKLEDLQNDDTPNPDDMHVLNVTGKQLHRLTSTKNVELIRAVSDHQPDSINELAEKLERGYKEVHRNVSQLEEMGVLELEQDGRSKKPVFGYDEIDIQISL